MLKNSLNYRVKIDIDATAVNGQAMVENRPHPKVGDTFEWDQKHKLSGQKESLRADAKREHLDFYIRVEDKPHEDEDDNFGYIAKDNWSDESIWYYPEKGAT